MAQSPRESGSTETPPKPPSKGWYPAHHRHHTEGGSGLPASLPSLGHVSRSPVEHGAWAGTSQGPRELGPRRGGLLQGPCCLLERQRVTDRHHQCAAALAPHSVKCLLCVDWGDAESCEAQSKPGGARLCTKEKDREVSRYQETADETHAEIRINSSGYSAMKRHEPQIRPSASCCVNEARLKRLHTL